MILSESLFFLQNLKVLAIIYAVLIAFVVIASLFRARKYGRQAGDGYRKKGFVIITIVGFGVFLFFNRKTFAEMLRRNTVDDLGKVAYGSEAKAALETLRTDSGSGSAVLSGTEDEEMAKTSSSGNAGEDEESSAAGKNEASHDICEIKLLEDQQLPKELIEIKPAVVKASGERSEKRAAIRVTDSDSETNWQVTVNPEGEDNEIDEWLEFELSEECDIEYIVIFNGTSSTEKHFKENGRAKTIVISGNNSETVYASDPILLPDKSEENIIKCSGFKTGRIRIRLKSVYPGNKYPEVGITDIMFYTKKQ